MYDDTYYNNNNQKIIEKGLNSPNESIKRWYGDFNNQQQIGQFGSLFNYTQKNIVPYLEAFDKIYVPPGIINNLNFEESPLDGLNTNGKTIIYKGLDWESIINIAKYLRERNNAALNYRIANARYVPPPPPIEPTPATGPVPLSEEEKRERKEELKQHERDLQLEYLIPKHFVGRLFMDDDLKGVHARLEARKKLFDIYGGEKKEKKQRKSRKQKSRKQKRKTKRTKSSRVKK